MGCGTASTLEKSSCCMSQGIRAGKHRRELWLKPHPNVTSETESECENGPKCLRVAEEKEYVALDSGSGKLDNVETISTWGFFGHLFCYEKYIGVTWGARLCCAMAAPYRTFKPLLAFSTK
jgi:hypothetical protein